jgi:hypothetical protein
MKVTCRHCGNEFTPSFRAGRNTYLTIRRRDARARINARFCSAACSQAAYRARVKARKLEAQVGGVGADILPAHDGKRAYGLPKGLDGGPITPCPAAIEPPPPAESAAALGWRRVGRAYE